LVSPRRFRTTATWLTALALWTPVGLITPGVAYGEYLPAQGFTTLPGAGYLPTGVESLSRAHHPLLPFYQFPWVSQTAPISQQAVGYVLSGFLGIGAVMLLGWLLYAVVRRRLPKRIDDEDWRTAT
jgi:cobalt/nickel transport system permease protein